MSPTEKGMGCQTLRMHLSPRSISDMLNRILFSPRVVQVCSLKWTLSRVYSSKETTTSLRFYDSPQN
ncbi:hypothetical protein CDAR_306171 [Caerostris darwini]|uniref:Uncharacterized protein n=1 Tax=Caerostris darwini TaxID=1538125 RepID=A0AAV4TET7_9ARAC|nr:hypothetical protein CDAR_306171 [Caerostris darwini]